MLDFFFLAALSGTKAAIKVTNACKHAIRSRPYSALHFRKKPVVFLLPSVKNLLLESSPLRANARRTF